MKNKKMIIISVVCGLCCAACVFLYTQSVKSQAEDSRAAAMSRYGGEQIEVCVAKRDIASGEKIDSSCIETKLWLADLLPDEAVRNSNEILGKQVTSSLLCGEVFSQKRFQDNNISLEVPAGLSAVSVPAKDVSSVGGAISAGMHIDVYATGNISTSLIAQNVLVLSTSTSVKEASSNSNVSWITLAVEQSKVQELVSATQTTTLYFVLPCQDSNETNSEYQFNSNYQSINGSSGASKKQEEE